MKLVHVNQDVAVVVAAGTKDCVNHRSHIGVTEWNRAAKFSLPLFLCADFLSPSTSRALGLFFSFRQHRRRAHAQTSLQRCVSALQTRPLTIAHPPLCATTCVLRRICCRQFFCLPATPKLGLPTAAALPPHPSPRRTPHVDFHTHAAVVHFAAAARC